MRAMKKAIFLHPVREVIGSIGIKNQLLRHRGEIFDKEFDKQSAQIYTSTTIDSISESTQGAWSGNCDAEQLAFSSFNPDYGIFRDVRTHLSCRIRGRYYFFHISALHSIVQ